MRDSTFYDQLRSCFPEDNSKTAIETPDGRSWSYSDLDGISAQLASLLRDLGIRRGDRVAGRLDSSPEALCLYFACLRFGATYIPLPRASRSDELRHIMSDAEPKLVVCPQEDEEEIRRSLDPGDLAALLTLDADGGGSLFDRARSKRGDDSLDRGRSEDIAAILYTSGTTGLPKGAELTHGNLSHNAAALTKAWGFDSDDVLLHALPLHHVHGLFVACHCALLSGSKMVMLPRFDAREVVSRLPRSTVLMGVPTFYTRLLSQEGLTREACRNMRLFTSGSAPLRRETFRAFEERTGHRILERYGMTETLITFSNPLDGERRPGTVGHALQGIEARVVNEEGRAVDHEEVGMLEVRGPCVFDGYWRRPQQSSKAFRDDGFFITGDLARRDDGGRLSIVGRVGDLVITGGENVYPKEVERLLDRVEGVVESAVFGVPHPDWGEAVVAAVVIESSEGAPGASDIISALGDHLARHKVPKQVFSLKELPRNSMGKVQKSSLRQRYRDVFEPGKESEGTGTR